jgi:hypothetical protein
MHGNYGSLWKICLIPKPVLDHWQFTFSFILLRREVCQSLNIFKNSPSWLIPWLPLLSHWMKMILRPFSLEDSTVTMTHLSPQLQPGWIQSPLMTFIVISLLTKLVLSTIIPLLISLFQVFTLHPEDLLHVGDVVDVTPTLAVGLTQMAMATNSPIVVVLIQIAPTIVAVGVAEAPLPSTELLAQSAKFVTALGTLRLHVINVLSTSTHKILPLQCKPIMLLLKLSLIPPGIRTLELHTT